MDTKEVYDKTADRWGRQLPDSLSDFTARPYLFEAVGKLSGESVFDIGCGEGYCSRQLKRQGAGDVLGVDLSPSMIASAIAQESQEPLGIEYVAANVVSYKTQKKFDVCIAVFLFNYLSTSEMFDVMRQAYERLSDGGRFLFTVPHPFFPFIDDKRERPFYFESPKASYFESVDNKLEGEIWKRSGESLHVQCVHKTLDSYFKGLAGAGFSSLPEVKELSVTLDHVEIDPAFFKPLLHAPLHVMFAIKK